MPRYVQIAGLLAFAIAAVIGIFTMAAAEPPLSPAEQKIRRALEGAPGIETGDGMLEDVIGVIKQRGSILDGSSLDPNGTAEKGEPQITESKKAYAAEQLLRASRWLESVGSSDKDRADLVNRMRAEAAKLLSE